MPAVRRGGESLPLASATSRYANAKENFVICSALSCLPPPLRLGAPPLKPQKWAWKRQGELSPWLQRHCYRGEAVLQLRIGVRSVPVVVQLMFAGAHCRPSTPAIEVEAALQLRIRVRSVPVVVKLWNQGDGSLGQ